VTASQGAGHTPNRIFKGELCETLAQLGGDSINPDATDAPKVRAGECCEDGDHRDGGGHHLLIVAPRRRWLNDRTAASPTPDDRCARGLL